MNVNTFKKVKYFFLAVIITSVGLPTGPSFAQEKETQVNALVEALRQAAPPNSPKDGMYSPWQVLPGIIPSWTKKCTSKEMTPEQFDADEKAARQTVTCIVQRELQNQFKTTNNEIQAVRSVACWWMTGKAQSCDSGWTATYVQKVLSFYKEQLKPKS
jgi:hypothetical protein